MSVSGCSVLSSVAVAVGTFPLSSSALVFLARAQRPAGLLNPSPLPRICQLCRNPHRAAHSSSAAAAPSSSSTAYPPSIRTSSSSSSSFASFATFPSSLPSSSSSSSPSPLPSLLPLHPSISATPSWSTADLLTPPDGAAQFAPVTVEQLRRVAKQANINLAPTSTLAGEGEEEKEGRETGEEGVLRGINEVMRFVHALDRVNTDGVAPMWTPLRQSHASPLRSDSVAGKHVRSKVASAAAAAGTLQGAAAEDGAAGWTAAQRDDLLAMAPDSSRAPYFVTMKTAGTDDV
mmetsp:Transcript_37867/g.60724  ORF Transcript_37867/g.60724 Transcript_37867/m.60724 type:complete len:290 (+) Transcript_37867:85-954(+)